MSRLKQRNLGNGIFELQFKGRIFLMQIYPIKIVEIDSPLDSEIPSEISQMLEGSTGDNNLLADYSGFGAVEFVATTRCNLRCTHCTARTFDATNDGYYGLPSSDMSLDLMLKSIDHGIEQLESRLSESPAKIVNFEMFITGGEPLLVWTNLEAMLSFARERLGQIKNIDKYIFTPHIVTNGTLIDDEMARALVNAQTVITVALDSPLNQVRIDAQGKPATPKALQGLRCLIAAGHKRTNVNVVLAGEKINEVDEIFSYLEEQNAFEGVTSIQLSPLAPPIQHTQFAGKGMSCKYSGYRDPHVCSIFSQKLIEYSIRYKVDMKFYGAKLGDWLAQGGTRYRCPVAEWKWCATPQGDVYACHQLVGIDQYHMGNVKDAGWYNSDQARAIRQQFTNRTVFKVDLCQDCALCSSCMVFVDCPARSYLEVGDIYRVPQHYCLCAKGYLEELLGEHVTSLIDTGKPNSFPFIKDID